MTKTGIAAAVMFPLAMLPACESIPCKPTKTEARKAAVADLKQPLDSAVLDARLTAGGRALGSRTIEFVVDDNGNRIGEGTTANTGRARLDLKRQPTRLVDPARGGAYRAVFHGDAEYCPSQDAAEFQIAGT